jgi:hypothetical protein
MRDLKALSRSAGEGGPSPKGRESEGSLERKKWQKSWVWVVLTGR